MGYSFSRDFLVEVVVLEKANSLLCIPHLVDLECVLLLDLLLEALKLEEDFFDHADSIIDRDFSFFHCLKHFLLECRTRD